MLTLPTHLLGEMTPDTFLRDYWQKKPLLIRKAIANFKNPVTPDELAGLACEAEINSRIIIEKDADAPWQVTHGPFAEDYFSSLPETHWSLLVQDVNRYLPELAGLMDCFRFVPDWRLDDIMVSYAPEHGSVGAHIDNYDVFLLQGMGRRRWQINTAAVTEHDIIPGLDLRILKTFDAEQEWVLEPGDMLYLPPRVQHYGVALDDCMTYSIGFHAPERSELLADLAGWLAQHAPSNPRYADSDQSLPEHAGEIDTAALTRVRALIGMSSLGDSELAQWFGSFTTGNGQAWAVEKSFHDCLPYWQQQAYIERNPASRFAYARQDNALLLFINGQIETLSAQTEQAVSTLCDRYKIAYADVATQCDSAALAALWQHWYESGYLTEPGND
jgi:50S ribosomal protein L16 3-hydroxylase